MRPFNILAFVILIFGAFLLLGGVFFMLPETKQAIVTQFGRPVRIIAGSSVPADYAPEGAPDIRISHGAGLYWKLPFIQRVIILEDRLLEYDSEPEDVVTKDKKHLVVDNFARWRIVDPLKFLLRVQSEAVATPRLDDIVYSVVREELAQSNLVEIVRTTNRPGLPEELEIGREQLLHKILVGCDSQARKLGIQIVDVRIKQADLPPENRNAVYGRMRAERERVAKGYRSEGEEEALKIRAETDRDVRILKAEAYRDAERIKGEGDGQAAAIYAESYSQYADFYTFTKSLEVIGAATGGQDQLIIGMETGVYQYLK